MGSFGSTKSRGQLELAGLPFDSELAVDLTDPSVTEEVEYLERIESCDARVDEEARGPRAIAGHAREPVEEAIELEMAQGFRCAESCLPNRATPEKSVRAQSLVKRQEHEAVLFGADLAFPVAREKLAFVRMIEVSEARFHSELVLDADGVTAHDLHDVREVSSTTLQEDRKSVV